MVLGGLARWEKTTLRGSPTPHRGSYALGTPFAVSSKEKRLKEIEGLMSRPGFWDAPERSRKTVGELKALKAVVEPVIELEGAVRDLRELLELGRDDPEIVNEVRKELDLAEESIGKVEFSLMLSGEDDPKGAFVSVQAGAGGTESCDWAQMLVRMLTRYAERRGFEVRNLSVQHNEEAGIRSATMRVSGPYAYGYLRSEAGVHRLVRISPFDANARRHTSFASVDVMPEEEEEEIKIDPKDLVIDRHRSSGAGGQHVNVTDSGVRITHIPTRITVNCENERSQHRNLALAMKVLTARLKRLREMERQKELQQLYDDKGQIAFGSQVRSYVLHPYKLAKDHRTSFESSRVEDVLDGELDGFVEEYLRTTAGKGRR